MKISPKYNDDHYSKLTFQNENDWQTAIDIMEDRINGRFLKPINMIENYEYAGFAILALDCLLIETLQQFRKGLIETPRGKNRGLFVDFFTQTLFNEYFNEDYAIKFYKQVRNGILHQAETKMGTKIKITNSLPVVKLAEDGESIIINRKKFHSKIVDSFNNYLDTLRNGSDNELRNNFKTKMDHICRIKR